VTISSTNTRDQHYGNGASIVFNFSFKILDATHLEVIRTDASGDDFLLQYGIDYSVTGVGFDAGGTVNYPISGTPLATGEKLTIRRKQEFLQQVDLQNQGGFFSEVHEDVFDRLVMYALQNQEELQRALRFGATAEVGDFELPGSAAARANKVVSFDKEGNIIVSQEIGSFAGEWRTGAFYGERDFVKDASDNSVYLCLNSHTSTNSIANDAGNWEILFDGATSIAASDARDQAVAAKDAAQVAKTGADDAAQTASLAREGANASEEAASLSESSAKSDAIKTAQYRDEAFQWSAQGEGVDVEDSAGNSGYSAFHWAQKAAASASVVDGKIIKDSDGDTYIKTEENDDEDRVRIGTDGIDRVVIDAGGITINKSDGTIAYKLPMIPSTGHGYTLVVDSVTKEVAWDLPPNDSLEDHILLGFEVP